MQKHIVDSPNCQEMSCDSPPTLCEEQTQLDTNLADRTTGPLQKKLDVTENSRTYLYNDYTTHHATVSRCHIATIE